jgi:CrcB protein
VERLLWVVLGGGAGSGARFLVSEWARGRFGAETRLGTLAVNILGSFLLGALAHAAASGSALPPAARLALGAGFLGGFTTYSAFNEEVLGWILSGAHGRAVAYLAGTAAACLAAGWLGHLAARSVAGP